MAFSSLFGEIFSAYSTIMLIVGAIVLPVVYLTVQQLCVTRDRRMARWIIHSMVQVFLALLVTLLSVVNAHVRPYGLSIIFAINFVLYGLYFVWKRLNDESTAKDVELGPVCITTKTTPKWIQLSGHGGDNLAPCKDDAHWIVKKATGNEENCYGLLSNDALAPFVPNLCEAFAESEQRYLKIENLLSRFESPVALIDIKLGTRTYLESEVSNVKERPDLYEKMCVVDANAPTEEEHALKAITKARYMTFREASTTTASLGFRVDGISFANSAEVVDTKLIDSKDKVIELLRKFTSSSPNAISQYLDRLTALRATLQESTFFSTHEIIGSSLLMIHDCNQVTLKMIDFAKSFPIPDSIKITHSDQWALGNHEDGYLTGLDNLIRLFTQLSN